MTKPALLTVGTGTNTDTGAIYFTGSASNTYNGATNVYAGTLNLQKSGGAIAIPGNLNIGDAGVTANSWDVVNLRANEQIANSSVVSFNGASGSWAYLNLMGFNETVGGISDSSTFGIIQIQDTSTVNNNSTFTINNAADYSYNGVIRDKFAGAGTGILSLTKSGAGKQTLGGVNTYTGPTTINNGILELASTGQIATVSAINTAATSATFQVNGGTHTVGTISGVGTTNLLAGSSLTATSVIQGTVTLGIGARLTIAPIPGGPTAGAGTLTAVPEPSTWAMLMLAAMGLGMYWRRSR